MTARRSVPGIGSPARLAATCSTGAVLEAVIAAHFGWAPPLGAYLCFAALSVLVSATDLFSCRVPNRAVATGLVAGIVLLALASGLDGTWWALARAGIAGVALGCSYLALGLCFPSGMGMGDVKWAAVCGLYLGWLGWTPVATGTLLAFGLGALGILVVRIATGSRPLAVAIAPYMSAGALIAVLVAR